MFCTVYLADIVYGNGGIFKSMIVDKLRNGAFRISGNGNYFKNVIHVDDAVNAMINIITKNAANTSYIITDSNPIQFREFVNYTADRLGVKKPETVPSFLAKIALGGDAIKLLTRSSKANNEKIRNIYDFQYPSYKEGIQNVLSNF